MVFGVLTCVPLCMQAKVLVFLSTCKQVKYTYEVLRRLRPGVPLRCIHGKMKQMKRMAAFLEFSEVGISSHLLPSVLIQYYSPSCRIGL